MDHVCKALVLEKGYMRKLLCPLLQSALSIAIHRLILRQT